MGATVRWDDEDHRCLNIDYDAFWNDDDYFDFFPRIIEMLQSVDHSVTLIINHANFQVIPGNFMAIADDADGKLPDNFSGMIVVAAGQAVVDAYKLVNQEHPDLTKNLAFVDTLAEARTLAKQPPYR